MNKAAIILATAVAGILSLCAGIVTYGYIVVRDMPERDYRSQGPNAAWADHKWVKARQSPAAYERLAATLRRNHITDVYFYMGWVEPDGSIAAGDYSIAPQLLRELTTRHPSLRRHAWIGQVEKRGGGTLDLSDAEVRRQMSETAARFLALGFNGIHFGFPGAGSGNPHLLLLLDQTRLRTREFGATLSVAVDMLEPVPGLAWLSRRTGDQNGYWTRRYHQAVAARADQIAVTPTDGAWPADWLTAGFVAWQTRSLRAVTEGRTTLFMGLPPFSTADTVAGASNVGPVGPAIAGIRKGMSGMAADPFDNFGVALILTAPGGDGDAVFLESWLDTGDLVSR